MAFPCSTDLLFLPIGSLREALALSYRLVVSRGRGAFAAVGRFRTAGEPYLAFRLRLLPLLCSRDRASGVAGLGFVAVEDSPANIGPNEPLIIRGAFCE